MHQQLQKHQLYPVTLHTHRKSKVDWDVYKQLTLLSPTQITSSLHNACEDSVQNAIANTVQNFFILAEVDILTTLEKIVTHQANPAIHYMHFSSCTQNGQESIQDFAVRLQSVVECEFKCPNCEHDLSPISIKSPIDLWPCQ